MFICHPKEDLGHGNLAGIGFSLDSLLERGFAAKGDGVTTDLYGDMGEMRRQDGCLSFFSFKSLRWDKWGEC